MKKLINLPGRVVSEQLEGMARLHPGLMLLEDENAMLRADIEALLQRGEVAVVSGGGSGHEPAHAGFIGPGLLTAAVCGEVFASPGVDAIAATIRSVAGSGGVLLIVKNYTGDRLNFGLAAEMARDEGIDIRMVVVGDDVALGDAADTAGRRGLAGTLFVHKIAGAAAAAGWSLDEVTEAAQAAADSVRTMGVALAGCTAPGAERPGFELGADEIEVGLGIHGEPGVQRTTLAAADTLVDHLLEKTCADLQLKSGDRVALLINGLGSTPAMELAIVARRALAALGERGISVLRALCGSYLTALDMTGCSLSLMVVDDARLALLDATAGSSAWPAALARPPGGFRIWRRPGPPLQLRPSHLRAGSKEYPNLQDTLRTVATRLLEAEPELTELDRVVGDGDLGVSMARAATAIFRDLESYDLSDPAATLREVATSVRRAIGGTSGPLYAIGLLRASQALSRADAHDPMAWADALQAAGDGIALAGGARPGDRTMLDALLPAAQAMRDALARGEGTAAAITAAVRAAQAGVAKTASMVPRRGRSSYLGARARGNPDPGAQAVWIWLRAIAAVRSPAGMAAD